MFKIRFHHAITRAVAEGKVGTAVSLGFLKNESGPRKLCQLD
jgi:hypothetical protein